MSISIEYHLATVVMGWKYRFESGPLNATYYDPKKYDPELASDEQSYEVLVNDWDPRNNDKQALMCLDTFYGRTVIDKHWVGADLIFQVTIYNFSAYMAEDKSRTEAVCTVCAQATGWK